ncbi:MAG: Uma2 family endonuclease [Acidobacteriota bacterium]|nr:Uma2 family endonuclease [Acidobacteriota bacterium]
MDSKISVYGEERLSVPAESGGLAVFRRWAFSSAFPEDGRIDYLAGSVETDLTPEDLQTHGTVKAAIAAELHVLVVGRDLGQVFIDRARVSSKVADLSAEPDVVVVLWESLETRRVRYVPRAGGEPGRFAEIEGGPDLVVEIVSDSSVAKDTERLPLLYALAGVRELWLVDARGREPELTVHSREDGTYREVPPDAQGWRRSQVLALSCRLVRHPTRLSTWRYELEHSPS